MLFPILLIGAGIGIFLYERSKKAAPVTQPARDLPPMTPYVAPSYSPAQAPVPMPVPEPDVPEPPIDDVPLNTQAAQGERGAASAGDATPAAPTGHTAQTSTASYTPPKNTSAAGNAERDAGDVGSK